MLKKLNPVNLLSFELTRRGERIPLTFADWDAAKGTVTIVFQEAGATTCRLARLKAGETIENFVGPLGVPTHIEKLGTVVCVGGGIGVAPITPIARALKQAGNKVISIMGARSKNLLFWEDKLRQASSELTVTTDDGTYGRKGLVTEPLKEALSSQKVGPGYCHRTNSDDEILHSHHQAVWRENLRQPQSSDGRRYRDVRMLPCFD